mgnify:CR=1 FL=1
MNAPRDLPLADDPVALLDDRLQRMEAFADQAGSAIEQLVNAVVEVQQRPSAEAPTAELDALKTKLRELEIGRAHV